MYWAQRGRQGFSLGGGVLTWAGDYTHPHSPNSLTLQPPSPSIYSPGVRNNRVYRCQRVKGGLSSIFLSSLSFSWCLSLSLSVSLSLSLSFFHLYISLHLSLDLSAMFNISLVTCRHVLTMPLWTDNNNIMTEYRTLFSLNAAKNWFTLPNDRPQYCEKLNNFAILQFWKKLAKSFFPWNNSV